MENYKGYNADFLGVNVPLPELSDELLSNIAPVKNADEDILHYANYSVVQHAERRLPIFSIANIDGSKFQKLARKQVFPGGSDRWRKDKRIAYKHQWGNGLYSAKKSDFDRGHMTKREDVQWGDTLEEAKEGARSTFYFTNAAPQRGEVNRALWRKLEDYILHDETTHKDIKINLLTGPVLKADDPIFVTEVKGLSVQIPTLFWKIVYFKKIDGELCRVAFLMGQKHLLEKHEIVFASRGSSEADNMFMEFEGAETFQVNVSLIETLTGLTFSPATDVFQDDRPSQIILDEVSVRDADGTSKTEEYLTGLVL